MSSTRADLRAPRLAVRLAAAAMREITSAKVSCLAPQLVNRRSRLLTSLTDRNGQTRGAIREGARALGSYPYKCGSEVVVTTGCNGHWRPINLFRNVGTSKGRERVWTLERSTLHVCLSAATRFES